MSRLTGLKPRWSALYSPVVEQFALPFAPERRTYTVAELSAAIRDTLDKAFFDIWVSGEISGVKLATSGHYYFTLKDASAQLRCVCFRSAHRFFKVKPQDGIQVLVRGRIDVYEARGEYQFIVEALQPRGHGALQFAFEQLKKKLAAEGLFDASRKRPLPPYPKRIGIVTSLKGAVISDLLNILERRYPGLHIRIYPAQVQGDMAVEEVCRGIEYFSRTKWADVLIVARGGGSLEDLWTFNEEAVARAIAACSVPVVSAVGHETDVTIADFVADVRAPTPSAAAELVVGLKEDLERQVVRTRERLLQALRYRAATLARRLHQQGIDRALSLLHREIGRNQQRVDDCGYRMRGRLASAIETRRRRVRALEARLRDFDPRPKLARNRARHQSLDASLGHLIRIQIDRRRARLDLLSAKLSQMSPLTILERGYAIVTDAQGKVLMDAGEAAPDSEIRVRLARGQLDARVTRSSG